MQNEFTVLYDGTVKSHLADCQCLSQLSTISLLHFCTQQMVSMYPGCPRCTKCNNNNPDRQKHRRQLSRCLSSVACRRRFFARGNV